MATRSTTLTDYAGSDAGLAPSDLTLSFEKNLRQYIHVLGKLWNTYQMRRMDRQVFQSMLTLDEAILKDIGVTRDEVIWANNLPLSQNAALELRKIARARRMDHCIA